MNKPIVFMFSGQGSQYYHMGRELFLHDNIFRGWIESLDKIVFKKIKFSIIDELYNEKRDKGDLFNDIKITSAAIFMVEYALCKTLIESRIYPDYLLGSSLGEYVCLALSGVINFEDIVSTLLDIFDTVCEKCDRGGMIAILDDINLYYNNPFLYQHTEIAAINLGSHFVISGKEESLKKVENYLTNKGIVYQTIPVRYGFHSSSIDCCRDICKDILGKPKYNESQIPIISCVHGDIVINIDKNYLWEVIRKPIQFQKTIANLEEKGSHIYLDLGPAGTLATFVKYNLNKKSKSEVFYTLTPFGQCLKNYKKVKEHLIKIGHQILRRDKKMTAWVFPGQGSQLKGMGEDLFDHFKDLTQKADTILGYSIKDLCMEDLEGKLNQTQYTQPALYIINAFHYFKKIEETGKKPDFVAGHSLGEYNALLASEAFDFETGLKLVKKRGELMSHASGGAMAAVINLSEDKIMSILKQNGLIRIDIANYNSPSQIVISGLADDVNQAVKVFKEAQVMCIPLKVSGAFHSRYMKPAKEEFEKFILEFSFAELKIPIIANATARRYRQSDIVQNLVNQITHSVRWTETVQYLIGKGEVEFEEVGPGKVLTNLINKIKKEAKPIFIEEDEEIKKKEEPVVEQIIIKESIIKSPTEVKESPISTEICAESLGSKEFREEYNLKYSYVTGGMAKGIASDKLVICAGRAGIIGFYGTGGLELSKVEEAIISIQKELKNGEPYGMNLLFNISNPQYEEMMVDLFLKYSVRNVEAAAYMQMTQAIVRYRLKGLEINDKGKIITRNKIMGKISRPEIAEMFLSPAPERIVEKLLKENKISQNQADLSKKVPIADALCVESDSGGHTDQGVMTVLLPTIIRLRDEIAKKYGYDKNVYVGAGGGIGTPEAAASAFILGADFILTGSINQCTVEACTSDAVKDILEDINVQDTTYAPAGDMFEIGAKVQVVRKGIFFPARANKLYELYRQYNSIDEIDEKTKQQLQDRYFKRSFDDIYAETKAYYSKVLPDEVEKAERNPKHKMALIFKWYFVNSLRLAREGRKEEKVDFQIYSGPALGAFNQWVKGSNLQSWKNRHVDKIALKLMQETAFLLNNRFRSLLNNI
ncbi:MAG: ACP S-malonyltransferase [Desulfobacterales bacterium]|nr:ACP S-malonyltransferase [Desulfobacterales bacterium]